MGRWEYWFMGAALVALVLFAVSEFRKSVALPVADNADTPLPVVGMTPRYAASLWEGPTITLRQDEYKVADDCDCEATGNG